MNHFFKFWGILLVALFAAPVVEAAELNVYSNSTTYAKDEVFAVEIRLSSPDEPVNAVSYALSYPEDVLELRSITRNDDPVSFWIEDGTSKSEPGMIHMEGLMVDVAFQGEDQLLAVLTFVAKDNLPAAINITEAAIHAYNGLGTNIFSGDGVNEALILSFEGSVTDRDDGDRIVNDIFNRPEQSQTSGFTIWDMFWAVLISILVSMLLLWFFFGRRYSGLTREEKKKFDEILDRL